MTHRFLLDTHVFVRWVWESRRLSREQLRILAEIERRNGRVAVSAVTLIELALLASDDRPRIAVTLEEMLTELRTSLQIDILPITIDIAAELGAMGDSLRDPFDRAIVATARVHGLGLLTSDERIVDSGLVKTVD